MMGGLSALVHAKILYVGGLEDVIVVFHRNVVDTKLREKIPEL